MPSDRQLTWAHINARTRKQLRGSATVLAIALFSLGSAQAVVIDSGRGQGNTRAPKDDPGWNNIGTIEYMTGVYLGNHWVLTAWHVGSKPIELGGKRYEPVGRYVRTQARTSEKYLADLILFQVREKPDLPPINIVSKPVEVGQWVLMIGNGRDRNPPRQAWNEAWQIVHPNQAVYSGYTSGGNHSLRWGTNRVAAIELLAPTSEEVVTRSFATSFDIALPTPHEAQASSGDSGGPVFTKNEDGEWELAGIMTTVANHPNQPRNLLAYGNATYAADLHSYRDFIVETVKTMPDRDKDGVLDIHDNCPRKKNPEQQDSNGDGVGDACEEPPETENKK